MTGDGGAADVAAAGTAVLVVDVQRGLVEGDRAVPDAEGLLVRLRDLVSRARAAGVPVVQVQDAGLEDPAVTRGSEGWELSLSPTPDQVVIEKHRDDAFDGTPLESVLRSRGVQRLVVVGVQSEMCVAATARGALARGFDVVLPRDGHATYDLPAREGDPAVPASVVSRVAAWSLGDAIAELRGVTQVEF